MSDDSHEPVPGADPQSTAAQAEPRDDVRDGPQQGAVAPAPSRTRTCILVLGMHRSGTSALTRAISLMGAALPKNVLGPGVGNETGHWEPAPLVTLHDAMLGEAGSTWYDWRQFDFGKLPGDRLAQYKAEIRRLIETEYDDAPLFVLKEPRICRFVPLYLDILGEMGITVRPVVCYRNPLEVAASLEKRNGMRKNQSLLVHLRHFLEAESHTRALPRAIVLYSSLLDRGFHEVQRLFALPDVAWMADLPTIIPSINSHLDATRRHHAFARNDLNADPLTAGWLKQLDDCFVALGSGDAPEAAVYGVLDGIAAELCRAAPFIDAVETNTAAEIARLNTTISEIGALARSATGGS